MQIENVWKRKQISIMFLNESATQRQNVNPAKRKKKTSQRVGEKVLKSYLRLYIDHNIYYKCRTIQTPSRKHFIFIFKGFTVNT